MMLIDDETAFAELAERHRRELQVHCYRMLGSYEESEDLVQETFLRAWRRRETFEGRSTFRAWLYRIATNACLDFLERNPRRPAPYQVPPGTNPPDLPAWKHPLPDPGVRPVEVRWLQPYPDRLMAPPEDEPDAQVVAKETIELAYLIAIQHLPPRQRAVLILRDVLGWRARETAELLETTEVSVKSALQRARATLKEHLPRRREDWAPSTEPTQDELAVLERYIEAMETRDTGLMARLLAEDVKVTMPPEQTWFLGRDPVVTMTAEVFDPDSDWFHGDWRGVPIRANRQPGIAFYVRRPGTTVFRRQVLEIFDIRNGLVTEITAFHPRLFPTFPLPETL
jgi:RNA polymerase sigma-70 factor, ECF subfamily